MKRRKLQRLKRLMRPTGLLDLRRMDAFGIGNDCELADLFLNSYFERPRLHAFPTEPHFPQEQMQQCNKGSRNSLQFEISLHGQGSCNVSLDVQTLHRHC